MPRLQIEFAGETCSLFYGTGGVSWNEGAPLVVLLHGAGNDHTVWSLPARALAQNGLNIAALDLPGHGASGDSASIGTIEDYAHWVLALIETIGASEVSLVGHSMGSCITLTLAKQLEERVHKLALLGAGQAMPVNPDLLEATLHRPLDAHRFITAFGYGRPSHFGRSETPGVWNLGAAMALLERSTPEVLHRDFAACNQWRSDQLQPLPAAPTLVLCGALDRMTPSRAGKALAESLPQARFELLPGVGHMMMDEAPGAVTDALLSFLS